MRAPLEMVTNVRTRHGKARDDSGESNPRALQLALSAFLEENGRVRVKPRIWQSGLGGTNEAAAFGELGKPKRV
ncbi:hypothetical protein [Streptomyces sp. NRRL S-1824]|uniref:hypothetical protein n=1 Tax=Streptomyces sp. NRRL S-1824 TaxID=1463889 RepID=UPI00131CCC4B|nr:hypothetical protein [Streptomyces sp. NRRL S-1824]